jgi:dienelactone hydrolase
MQKKSSFAAVFLILFITVTAFSATADEETYNRRPVPEETYRAYLEFLQYDNDIPLEGAVAYSLPQGDCWRREKIVYRSGFGTLVPGYLGIPEDSTLAPFPCILATHGAGDGISQGKNKRYIYQWMEALCKEGYAVLAVDARYHGERYHESGYRSVRDLTGRPDTRRETFMGTVVEWRRGIDYLESRPDIDAGRIGLIGSSMGTMYGSILTAADRRIHAAVFVVGGMFHDRHALRSSPAADQANYIGRIAPRPVMLINGLQDAGWATTGAKSWFAIAGEPKEQHWFDEGHGLSGKLQHYKQLMLDFFDQHVKLHK